MSFAPSSTMAELLTATLRRLGQGGFAVPLWTQTELLGYWQDGLTELTRQTNQIWDRDALDDLPPPANHSFPWEPDFIVSRPPRQVSGISNLDVEIHTIGSRAEYDFPWERDYAPSSAGPGEMDFTWERLYAPASSLHPAAVVALPEGHTDTERVAWSDRRIDALRSADLERKDRVYESAVGDVIAYTEDKDGYGNLRKYHIPPISPIPHAVGVRGIPRGVVDTATLGVFFMHLDEWAVVIAGVLDAPSSLFDGFNPQILSDTGTSWDDVSSAGFAGMTVEGSVGSLRVLPGYHPAHSNLGIARRLSPSVRNTTIEFRRTSNPISDLSDRPELPPYQLTYVRHYVCWRALKRRGPGQNLKLSEHYRQRWEAGIARVNRRLNLTQSQREIVLGGAGLSPTQPPLARPPWELDYGQLDRY